RSPRQRAPLPGQRWLDPRVARRTEPADPPSVKPLDLRRLQDQTAGMTSIRIPLLIGAAGLLVLASSSSANSASASTTATTTTTAAAGGPRPKHRGSWDTCAAHAPPALECAGRT